MGPTCLQLREAVSARLDGEDQGVTSGEVDAHLAGCDTCREWAAAARIPLAPLPPAPDLIAPILAAVRSVDGVDGVDGPAPTRPDAGSPPSAAAPVSGRPAGGRRRRRRPLRTAALAAVVIVAAAGVGAGGALLLHRSSPSGGLLAQVQQVAGSSQSSSRYPGATILPVGLPKPGVTLTDTSGRPFDLLTGTVGKVTLVYFGFTHCTDICPLNMALAAQALAKMPVAQARQVDVVFVTTDPARDNPAVLRSWLDHFSPTFVGLTGSIDAIHAAERTVQMTESYPAAADGTPVAPVGDYSVVHSAYTIVYGEDGSAHLQVDQTVRVAQYVTTLEHLITKGFQA